MSSHDTKNPNGEVHMGHVVEKPDPNAYLLERILAHENMLQAWKRVPKVRASGKVPLFRNGGEWPPPEDSERSTPRRSVVSAFGKHSSGRPRQGA